MSSPLLFGALQRRSQRISIEIGPLASTPELRTKPSRRRMVLMAAAVVLVAVLVPLLTLLNGSPTLVAPAAAPMPASVEARAQALDLPAPSGPESPGAVEEFLPVTPVREVSLVEPQTPPAAPQTSAVEPPTAPVVETPDATEPPARLAPPASVGTGEVRSTAGAQRRPLRPRTKAAEESRSREEAHSPKRRQRPAVARRVPVRLAPDDPGDREITGTTRSARRPQPRPAAPAPWREEAAETFTLPEILRPGG